MRGRPRIHTERDQAIWQGWCSGLRRHALAKLFNLTPYHISTIVWRERLRAR